MKLSYLVALSMTLLFSIQNSLAQRKIQGTIVEVVGKKALQGVAVQLVNS